MEYFLGFVFICLVLGAIGIVYGKKDEEVIAPVCQRVHRPANISEPVLSIVKTFSEKGRWKIKPLFNLFTNDYYLCKFEVTDTVTGEDYIIHSYSRYYHYTTTKQFIVPNKIHSYSKPSWMTEDEWKYVTDIVQSYMDKINERFKVIEDRQRSKNEKQAKVNQDKERARLVALYCK
jgi:hypothetical protein